MFLVRASCCFTAIFLTLLFWQPAETVREDVPGHLAVSLAVAMLWTMYLVTG